MALNTIADNDVDLGSSANDDTGDDLRAGGTAINAAHAAIDSNFAKVDGDVLVAFVEGTPNGTAKAYLFAPHDCTVQAIKPMAPGSAPASAGGAYTLTVVSGGNSLIDSPPFNLEGLSGSETVDNVTLTTTTADLDLSAAQLIVITVTSDNADLTDPDFYLAVFIQAR